LRSRSLVDSTAFESITCDDAQMEGAVAPRITGGINAVEPLGADFRGTWFMNPANVVHMVREPDAW
jgi:hypothetical protein